MSDFNVDTVKKLMGFGEFFELLWPRMVNTPTRVTDPSANTMVNLVRNTTDIRVSVINTAISGHYGRQVIIGGHMSQIRIKSTKKQSGTQDSLIKAPQLFKLFPLIEDVELTKFFRSRLNFTF